jgi:hypothetical protein
MNQDHPVPLVSIGGIKKKVEEELAVAELPAVLRPQKSLAESI